MKAWGSNYMVWVRGVPFERFAEQSTFVDYLAEVDHVRDRIERLEKNLDQALEEAPPSMKAVVEGLQALRGVAKLSALTIVAEVGQLSRFENPSQLMGYSGLVPSEHSTGGPGKANRGGITKTGDAHLRRIIVEAAWSYRYRPALQCKMRARQEGLSEEVKAIAWKAQHRLHQRHRHLTARGKLPQQVVTAVGRELLGFIWAIGVQVERQQAA